jgi:hypothetical protein
MPSRRARLRRTSLVVFAAALVGLGVASGLLATRSSPTTHAVSTSSTTTTTTAAPATTTASTTTTTATDPGALP